jgi:hypothetical protein
MRAGLRLGLVLLAAGLALGPVAALAQNAVQATAAPPPATDTVGPRELQNFSLEGNVTKPAGQPLSTQITAPIRTQRTQARPAPATTQPPATAAAPDRATAGTSEPTSSAPAVTERRTSQRAPEPLRQTPPASSVTVALPRLSNDPVSSATAAVPALASGFSEEGATTGNLAPEHKLPILPWLLAAAALGAGLAFLFWRNRSREALAGGPQLDAFTAPEPAPAPKPRAQHRPAPAPPKATPSSIPGIVSTRLRPWVEIGFHPLRCIVEEKQVTIEFELELFNSGSAPARAILVEATLFNASNNQDQELNAFFGNPVGEGERIVAIQPLKRMALRTQVVTPREQVQVFEVAGRKVFVPVLAFNALYRWSGGDGQTSVSYLVGRDTKGEKMAPFRLDLGPRLFRGVGGRLLPSGVRI